METTPTAQVMGLDCDLTEDAAGCERFFVGDETGSELGFPPPWSFLVAMWHEGAWQGEDEQTVMQVCAGDVAGEGFQRRVRG